ncbi:2-oxoacid dehydrogenases acyltransferase-domain-containing protein [Yarrowia lipolytica]|uniref:Acetyltransferase component of pyruvate dehydrogenase complex n=1 Tax=Yarrowia lipolytica TaxID=4952 RepID=A0A371C2P6_YARLL|nr:2-oxoacid dehydrogenases acyltransferase-domain-containing protein [Yarrowia lipolytica]RDW31042.1 2-oxoacid dehydrogenases acyltransferase-domain-containing protein [Yarrowia lipolytica]RDW37884.1 2-oxoacid dehydrogenases acyltransferase-domain-containing protein [Yarrowia lipolytica]RDW43960.1 2-oxoacid dehydrogenases acyltransferase-domain-containing protein [Yarrowia lipolytica]RDW50691.1 2-oxoacid dehydrogenases acyltransferase-domain-containing protein [Yarrowia lipolytica]
MTQGNIGAWQKSVGDALAPGEVLVEIETDKAQMDFEFQDDGYLAKILLDAGAKDIAVGTPIGVYVEDEADVAAFKDFTIDDAGGVPKPPKTEEQKEEEEYEAEKAEKAEKEAEASKEAASPAPSSQSSAPAAPTPPSSRIFASPMAKTIALEKGIKLSEIKGSGPGGRIIKRDVENWTPPAAPAAKAAPAKGAAPAAAAAAGSAYTDIPLTNMRKTIASRLTQSKNTSPDYIVSSTVSVSKLLKLRAALNASSDGTYKLSINDLLVKALAVANTKVPQVNSQWLESEGVIRQFTNVDVSVAVATPTGLITPVVKNANLKGLAEISKEIKALGKKAKDGKLAPEEYQGGTVTISNLGMNHAVSFFTAIINPPQAAILAVGTTERKAIEDVDSEAGFVFDDVVTLTTSFDHRVVDGAVGGEWVKALKQVVENPIEMLL